MQKTGKRSDDRDFCIFCVTGRTFRYEHSCETLLSHALELSVDTTLAAPIRHTLAYRCPYVYF